MKTKYLFFLGKYVFVFTLSFFLTTILVFSQNNQPHVHIDVKREFDKNGNVVRYDSTYSLTWSSNDLNLSNDSIFFESFPKSDLTFESPFSFFENDSTLFNSFMFFNDAFDFNKQMEQIIKTQEEILKQHQAIINHLQQSKKLFAPAPNIQQPNRQTVPSKETPKEKTRQQGVDL